MRALLLCGMLIALLGGGIREASAEPASLAEARFEVETARAEVERLSARHRALAETIDRLKREGETGAALRQHLSRSVQIESALRAADAERRAAEAELLEAARARIETIDGEIRARVPRLREGSLESRRSEARRIQALRDERAELRAQIEAATPVSVHARWSAHDIEPDPLDGPEELREKADFVEDTRDKLRRKRDALAELVREARRSRRIARAAAAFSAESRLFDEGTRPGRVIRGAGVSLSNAADPPDVEAGAGAPQPSTGGERGPDDGMGSGAPAAPGESLDPSIDQGGSFSRGATDGSDLGAHGSGEAASPLPAPSGTPRTPEPTVEVTTRDLGRLLEVDPARLDPSTASPADVEALLERLEAAEAALARAARDLRSRADRLESR